MVFDEGDGCQLFAELLQHDHALQQSHVVDAARRSRQGGEKRLPNITLKDKECRTTRKYVRDALWL